MNSHAHWQLNNDYHGFLETLQSIINKKYSAMYLYGKLINDARTKEETSIIRTIIDDELKHYEQFADMYRALTGREPNLNISREWLENNDQALYVAFTTEQQNVSLYLDMSERAPTPLFRKQFERASADEQNHAVSFLSVLTMN